MSKLLPGTRVKYNGTFATTHYATGTVVEASQINHPFWNRVVAGSSLFVCVDDGMWSSHWDPNHKPYFCGDSWEQIVDEIAPSTKQEVKQDLKEANSDGRTQCVACGGPIKEPYPGIRYCPKCEV